jgi:hypothetical protein
MHNPAEPVSSSLEVPNDGPVIYLTRDFLDGKSGPVNVWIQRPSRFVNEDGIEWKAPLEPSVPADRGRLGAFTDAAVRDRFGYVPGPDECTVLDNPKVN